MFGDAASDFLGEQDRDGVAELAHRFGPRAVQFVTVGEGLQPGAFTDRKVTDASVLAEQHVLAAWDTVVSRFEGFGGQVDWATRVPWV